MRPRWWKATKVLLQRWQCGYMLSTGGVSQELLSNVGSMTCMVYCVSLGQVPLIFINGGSKLSKIHMRYDGLVLFNDTYLVFFRFFFFAVFCCGDMGGGE